LLFMSSFFVVIAAFVGLVFYPPFQKYRFILISYVVTMALFLFFRAKNYYALGLYPVLLAFGAVYLEAVFSNSWRYYLRALAIAFVLVTAIPLLYLGFPVFDPATIASHTNLYQPLGLLRWEDGNDHLLPQDFADMTGWKELAQKTDSVYSQLPDKESTLVLCDNYGEAGAINYYSRFSNIQAVSFNADYINWMPLKKPIKNAILVKDMYDSDSTREKEKPLFNSVSYSGQIENPYAREKGTKIYLLLGAKTDINSLLRNEIERRRPAKP
ncbi:MAG TPA: glycosyl transferase, partial [Flavisolibacter sp.]|nr:glycosyl transferase [Flavisolibacter sp.]